MDASTRRRIVLIEERYDDCDRCGERYNGEFIDQYLRDEEVGDGEVRRVCCTALELEDLSCQHGTCDHYTCTEGQALAEWEYNNNS